MTAITSKTFTYGPALSIPRGARAAAEVFLAASRLLAGLFTLQPKRSQDMSAEDVRRLAMSVQNTDPGFAADLLAALARQDVDAR
ncbi:hypothetical protein [Ideonella sp.]|uniref:hypothetical protein n=1 Tax=Ideonella sp. TaxID=1929293 RepID=UPI002B4A2F8A|nr:hypothetical protein [Ideonella sp.]HJV72249.1 hypothetical protein [Ideonella sp.]